MGLNEQEIDKRVGSTYGRITRAIACNLFDSGGEKAGRLLPVLGHEARGANTGRADLRAWLHRAEAD